LIIHHFPDERATTLPPWLYKIKLWGYKKVIKHAVINARTIITPSEFTKNDILKFYTVDENKIKVIYEGISNLNSILKIKNYKLNKNLKLEHASSAVRRGGGIKNYLLYVGSAYPHKNLEKLIDAFAILHQKYKLTDLKLVLVGKIDYFYNKLQKFIIPQYPPPIRRAGNIPISNIIFYDYASDSELSQLYQNAKIFVFPSLYEGFGLPPLEAMSFGTPVAASNLTSIPEVCGNAATYFDPNDANDMAAKIHKLYFDSALQSELRQNGFEQIKKYSWTKMAQETLRIYKLSLLARN
ncbi:MAG: glycosyltransferase family 1 protein, partial [Candidatus Jacksonbacteria bacterium]